MVDLGSYLLGALYVAVVTGSLGFSAFRLRRRLLPDWQGAPARLIESIVAIALLIWISEILGTFSLFYVGALVAVAVLLAGTMVLLPAGPVAAGDPPPPPVAEASSGMGPPTAPPTGGSRMSLVAMVVVAIVVGHWALTAKSAVDRGIFNFDSLWYHLPFAVDMVQSHSVSGMHHVDTVFTNWFYPQNSELLHAVGILLTGRDTLSLFLNFGWLAVAFLAAYCIGRPYGRGYLTLVAAAILLECHTLVVREPGAAKNDLAAAAPMLAALAILVNLWGGSRGWRGGGGLPRRAATRLRRVRAPWGCPPRQDPRAGAPEFNWALAAAGLAVGLSVGTKSTALAMAAAATVAVIALAPAGRRWAAAAWWLVPAVLGGGYWYLRNLIDVGNPIPQIAHLGPFSLPHPERLQTARPDFSIAHYATDTGIWRHYFAPSLHDALGTLWPLVILGAVGAALLAVVRGRDRVVRWVGAVALFGMLAYLFTPLSAAGAEGAPTAFGINIRYAIPALLAGIVLLPLPRWFGAPRRQWGLLIALVFVLLLTDRPDVVARDPDRVFALLLIAMLVMVPAALWLARERGAGRAALLAGAAALAVAVVAIGYPLQRHYLRERFRNEVASESIPGMDLDSAYRWARGRSDARIGLAGTTAGFAQYGFYGTDLSNRVVYLGAEGPHGAFNAIPTCEAFRVAVNAADLNYLVTAPFLNFLHPDSPIPSPETRWLRDEPAVNPLLRSGPVTVWRVRGRLRPAACGPRNAPLREIPNAPSG
jgi:hypothetical protein